jgi:hypothetical protein
MSDADVITQSVADEERKGLDRVKLRFYLLFGLSFALSLLPLVVLYYLSRLVFRAIPAFLSFFSVLFLVIWLVLGILCYKKRYYPVMFVMTVNVTLLPVVLVILDISQFWYGWNMPSVLVYLLTPVLAGLIALWISDIVQVIASGRGQTALGVYLSSILAGISALLCLVAKTLEIVKRMYETQPDLEIFEHYTVPDFANADVVAVLTLLAFIIPFAMKTKSKILLWYLTPFMIFLFIRFILAGSIISQIRII